MLACRAGSLLGSWPSKIRPKPVTICPDDTSSVYVMCHSNVKCRVAKKRNGIVIECRSLLWLKTVHARSDSIALHVLLAITIRLRQQGFDLPYAYIDSGTSASSSSWRHATGEPGQQQQ